MLGKVSNRERTKVLNDKKFVHIQILNSGLSIFFSIEKNIGSDRMKQNNLFREK